MLASGNLEIACILEMKIYHIGFVGLAENREYELALKFPSMCCLRFCRPQGLPNTPLGAIVVCAQSCAQTNLPHFPFLARRWELYCRQTHAALLVECGLHGHPSGPPWFWWPAQAGRGVDDLGPTTRTKEVLF